MKYIEPNGIYITVSVDNKFYLHEIPDNMIIAKSDKFFRSVGYSPIIILKGRQVGATTLFAKQIIC